MKVHAARKLFLFGRYSLAMLLPKKWLTELGAKRGEMVTMELDRRRNRVVLLFEADGVDDKPLAKQQTSAPNQDDLEPIPQIQN